MRGEQRTGRPRDRETGGRRRARADRARRCRRATDGPARIATPTNPTTIPTTARRGSRSPRKIPPRIATQTGIIAISSAVMPDGTVCSPKATMPIPPPSRSAPTIALSRHSRRVGMTNDAALAGDRPGQQDRAGQQEAGRRHQERRDRVDRDRDPEVGRAPDDVEDEHPEPDRRAPRRRGRRLGRWHRGVVQDNRSIGSRRLRRPVANRRQIGRSGPARSGTSSRPQAAIAADAGRQTRQAR